jgi:phosphoribosylamine--glycine ligase
MKILLVGGGGREHALAWKLAQSSRVEAIYCAPGNPGIEDEPKTHCVDIGDDDVVALTSFAREHDIDLVVPGPEAPLVAGLVDAMEDAGIPAFGPGKQAAALEGSKAFTKQLCAENSIPTPAYGAFTDSKQATQFIREHGAPIVVKADGLAAGKGVVIAESEDEAIAAAKDMLSGEAFGEAGSCVVIEECLQGQELSFFALSDGEDVLPLVSAEDYKKIGEGDTGANTGGVGAFSPSPQMSPALEREIVETILKPTISGMAARGTPFKGVLYAGLMLVNGRPYLLEYNVRFGDPECQPVMLRLSSDLASMLMDGAQGALRQWRNAVQFYDQPALGVVLVSKGYPGQYAKNKLIYGMDELDLGKGEHVFQAGTWRTPEGKLLTAGGRVMSCCARRDTLAAARERAYEIAAGLCWDGMSYRGDIGAQTRCSVAQA